MATRLSTLALSFLLLYGCARDAPRAGALTSARASSAPPRPAWVSRLERDHPLVGKTWDVRRRAYVDDAALLDAARGAHFVLLGEKHDDADHHRLQAWVVGALVAAGRAPAVAFEQIDADRQAAVDDARRREPGDVDAIARAVEWAKSGWPAWESYAPIARVAVESRLPIVAANLPHAMARGLVRQGPGAMADAERARLGLDRPLPQAAEASLRRELRDVHCGMEMPEPILAGMILAERARDATMADRMIAADRDGGVVLVAGSGHTRTDRGAPAQLALAAPARTRVSIAFVEVDPALRDPAAYGARWGDGLDAPPFDYVSFTPRANDDDPCAALRRGEKSSGREHGRDEEAQARKDHVPLRVER